MNGEDYMAICMLEVEAGGDRNHGIHSTQCLSLVLLGFDLMLARRF